MVEFAGLYGVHVYMVTFLFSVKMVTATSNRMRIRSISREQRCLLILFYSACLSQLVDFFFFFLIQLKLRPALAYGLQPGNLYGLSTVTSH